MLGRIARQEARNISLGAPIEETTASKIAFYGLVARSLDTELLPDTIELSAGPTDFKTLEKDLSCQLKDVSFQGHNKLDKVTQYSLGTHLGGHVPIALGWGSSRAEAGYKRVEEGCTTAASIEVITLRTIAAMQAAGEKTSLQGLYASAKVPLRIAMMHLSDLTASRDFNPANPSAREHYDLWEVSDGGDDGLVFKPEDVVLDPDTGLSLINVREGYASEAERSDKGPQIGCPAMLVRGYINKIHKIATDAALTAGLVEAS